MSEFKKIETQEELDAIIGERLERAKQTAIEPFKDYEEVKTRNSELEQEVTTLKGTIDAFATEKSGYETTIADLNSKTKAYETNSVKMRIALEKGLPLDVIDRLRGDTEEDIAKDAETLSKLINTSGAAEPTADPEGEPSKDSSYVALLNSISE